MTMLHHVPPTTDPTTTVLPGEEFAALRADLHGDLVLPGEHGWDRARSAWQLLVDQQPAAIVEAADAADVALTVRHARRLGLAVAPQATGHAAGTVDVRGCILLRTTRMRGVSITGDRARVAAGSSAGEVAAAAQEHGLAAVLGMAPGVGAVGMTLGGGLGWLARSHGLAANSVLAVEGIDAQGRSFRADADHEPELFWALRGGTVPVIVTALEVRLHRVGPLLAGTLLWPIERTLEVVRAWAAWTATLPEAVTSLVRVLRYPDLPQLPEPVRGRSFVAVESAIQADAARAQEILAPLRLLGPLTDGVRPCGAVDPVPALGQGLLLDQLTASALDAFVAAALAPPSAALLSIELRHLGGALEPGRGVGGAVADVAGQGLVHAVGFAPVPPTVGAVSAALDALLATLAPFASSRMVRNLAERPAPPEAIFGPATERLRALAEARDPDGVIRGGHPVR
jgi:FAD/FMN-containing dehydrogenase